MCLDGCIKELRERSLFMAGVGAEEKMVGTQRNMLPHLQLGKATKKIYPTFFDLGLNATSIQS